VASASIDTHLSQELETRIARALRGRERALVRVTFELPAWDPWRLLERAWQQGRPWFAWRAHDDTRTFLSLGAVVYHDARGDAPWVDTRAFCSAMREQMVTLSASSTARALPEAPLLVGGLGFDAGRERDEDSPWRSWAHGSLWVPEAVIQVSEGVGTLCVTRSWGEGDGISELTQWARAWADDLARAPEAPRPRPWARAPRRPVFQHEERAWSDRVEEALEAIEAQDLQKVVLARSVRFWAGDGERFDAPSTLRSLRRDEPDCDVFAVGHPDGSVFLGASPEPLLEVEGRSVRTVALAGTIRRGAGPEEDAAARSALVESEKDGREHALVVDAIAQALGPMCSRIETQGVGVRALTQVHHLETRVAGELAEGTVALDVVERLHPTPATCGWPRERARDWIAEHEGLDRGWYAGPVGWLGGSGVARFSVALRCALIRSDEAHAYGGAGIVRGSTPEGEWQETEAKLGAITQSLMTRAMTPEEVEP
jgi:salicylate biosynthesis isochorismate synthase